MNELGNHLSRIIVEDNGPGIADGEHTEVLRRFRRGSEATASGSGLGLSIVRRICELHSGSVRLENRTEGGLRCEVRLPSFAEPATAAQAPTATAPADQQTQTAPTARAV